MNKLYIGLGLLAIVIIISIIIVNKQGKTIEKYDNIKYVEQVDTPVKSDNISPHKFIMFYVDWCGYCQRAKPEFEQLIGIKDLNGKKVEISMINADQNKELASSYRVSGYPTILLIKPNGDVSSYNGGRTKTDFLQFLNTI